METRTITVDFNSGYSNGTVVELGRRGESGVRTIIFDISSANDFISDGEIFVKYKRSRSETPYIISAERVDETLVWEITAMDTNFAGIGEVEVCIANNTVILKSVKYKTLVRKSLDGDTTGIKAMPQPFEKRILENIAEAKEYSSSLENSMSEIKKTYTDTLAEVKGYTDLAQQCATKNGYLTFEIDDNGHLIMKKTENVDQLDFQINDNGELEVHVYDNN